jgi:uncharacterized protein (DUF433 family)
MNDRISIDNQIHFGKPCVAGTRVTVENVMELVEHGIPFSEISADYYPEITVDDVKACVHFARETLTGVR